ncbi:unnamed protein product [Dibothriocephalus latus]|uniref:BACK domain-containing protein n=1 Tax=Dibothriocephalus latus TaxID=60516 RepID=A0A3P6QYC8_DIBLA|nr:unnamed protein product [Dibothriocephalus latus]
MQETFQDLIRRDFFTKLPLDALFRVMQSEDLHVQTEDQVVLAISQWIGAQKHADGTERLPELLREIRWNAVSNEIRGRFASDENWLKIFPYFGNYMKECESWCRSAGHRLTPSPFNQKARFYNKKITLLVGFESHLPSPKYTFAVHDVSKPRENKIICEIKGRRYASTIAFRDKIAIIGGYKRHPSNAVTIFDVPTQRMKPAAPMTVARTECSAARCGDFIVVFGGKDAMRRNHATCELFRPLKNE